MNSTLPSRISAARSSSQAGSHLADRLQGIGGGLDADGMMFGQRQQRPVAIAHHGGALLFLDGGKGQVEVKQGEEIQHRLHRYQRRGQAPAARSSGGARNRASRCAIAAMPFSTRARAIVFFAEIGRHDDGSLARILDQLLGADDRKACQGLAPFFGVRGRPPPAPDCGGRARYSPDSCGGMDAGAIDEDGSGCRLSSRLSVAAHRAASRAA